MARNVRLAFIFVIGLIVFLASLYHNLFREELSGDYLRLPPVDFRGQYDNTKTGVNYAIQEVPSPLTSRHVSPNSAIQEVPSPSRHQSSRHVSSVPDTISSVSILFPGWDVLVVVSPETPLPSGTGVDDYRCVFQNNDTSPARPGRRVTFNRRTFKCELPRRVRRLRPYLQPILTRSAEFPPERVSPAPQLHWWNFLVYESLSTENDVILFAKGLNNRQGVNRTPTDLRCVFGDDGVSTAVTTSIQEVFRCKRPEPTAVPSSSGTDENERIKISLEISEGEKRVLPSLAYHAPRRKLASQQPKSLICACTMVYNVAKFLREWVVYHSKIGVEKFILYDNDSDDDLEKVVEEMVREGYNVSTLFWIWPKTQEAGFSHCAIYAKDSCTWMMYIDVDEFVYSPLWLNSSQPSNQMLSYLLPVWNPDIGQVMMNCYEFGPSNQNSHPVLGVTQGYNCRKLGENRHKSIVLLEAIDDSLLNVIHHFQLKQGYRSKKFGTHKVAVNHYKYQAWPEFKAKFRRRVSAYVVDWTRSVNLMSKDRAPGLGSAPVEPQGWPQKFCEVYDDRLKDMSRRWFGFESPSGHQMAWQR
ncbi:glycosyltransferase family 92 protein Os08g0121900 [Cornus florida]|uniref:glycosyltransferase family 92 protein Os08g0121900 n=1 Tax=Cornus florida TaxID=4283 RepID=UPI00289A42FB|nr:glycosyltransferase family 92 protein Os08g0121900 [Cornus florida]